MSMYDYYPEQSRGPTPPPVSPHPGGQPPYYPPPQRRSLAAVLWPLAILAVIGGLLVWRFWPHASAGLDPQAAERPVAPAGKLAEAEQIAIDLYRKAAPSVVNVTCLTVQRDRFSLDLLQIPRGTGSGFVWDEEGRIVTNYHVIEKAAAVKVTLADHSTWPARVLASDPNMDLAVLAIAAPKSQLKPITVGDSHSLKVGQWAFAIGNPFGLDQSLAPGYVSALGREIRSVGGLPIKSVIQTTAPINPGNSGGPLLDSSGRLIGVNTAILSETGTWAGIGFAIPVDDVNRVVTQLIRDGGKALARPGLGIEPAPDQVTRRLNIKPGIGVLLLDVDKGGAADAAGLRGTRRTEDGELILGDVLLEVNGERVRNAKELYARLQRYRVGQEVALGYARRDPESGEWEVRTAKTRLTPDPH
jgi:S1-C subfamily serine protease